MKKTNIIKLIKIFSITFFILQIFFSANLVYAQIINPLGAGNTNLFTMIRCFLDFIAKVGAALVVLAIIYSGYKFIAAQGSQKDIDDAKKYFYWAVIGGLLILTAQALAVVLCNTARGLGASSLSCSFGNACR